MKAAYLLALDPSSTCTGYAVFDHGGRMIEHGLYKPGKVKDDANTRIKAMSHDMRQTIAEYAPHFVVIEDTSGKVNRSRHGGGGAGLATYGKAIGFLMADASTCAGVKVETVKENVWTGGKPKGQRTMAVASKYRADYRPDADPGGDAADAIGLGEWWLRNQAGGNY